MQTISMGLGAIKRLLGRGRTHAGDYRAPVPANRASPTPKDEPRPSPARSSVPCWRTAEYSPERHASRLLRYLVSEAGITGDVLFEHILSLYWRMCTDLNWAPRAWNPVGRELRKLLPGAKKTYLWIYDANDGEPRRLRVYRIPTALTPLHMNATAASAEFTGPAMASAA